MARRRQQVVDKAAADAAAHKLASTLGYPTWGRFGTSRDDTGSWYVMVYVDAATPKVRKLIRGPVDGVPVVLMAHGKLRPV